MRTKLTLLEQYWNIRLEITNTSKENIPTPAHLWFFQELLYRIEVLEVCQNLAKAAPLSSDMKILIPHYQVVNAYLENLWKERGFAAGSQEKQQQQQTALNGLITVIKDFRQRFANYAPFGPEQYQRDIGRAIAAVLPVWVQYRNTITEIKYCEEEAS